MSEKTFVCSSCNLPKLRSDFSATQFKKKAKQRKCLACFSLPKKSKKRKKKLQKKKQKEQKQKEISSQNISKSFTYEPLPIEGFSNTLCALKFSKNQFILTSSEYNGIYIIDCLVGEAKKITEFPMTTQKRKCIGVCIDR